jgi:hypothetical protein
MRATEFQPTKDGLAKIVYIRRYHPELGYFWEIEKIEILEEVK